MTSRDVCDFSSSWAWSAVIEGPIFSTHCWECFKIWLSSSAIWISLRGVSCSFPSIYWRCQWSIACWNNGILVHCSWRRMCGMRSLFSASILPMELINPRSSWRALRKLGASSLYSWIVVNLILFLIDSTKAVWFWCMWVHMAWSRRGPSAL